MATRQDAREAFRRVLGRYKEKTKLRLAFTGDGKGAARSNFYYDKNEDYIWVRIPSDMDAPFPVLNRNVAPEAVNVPVWLGKTEIEPEEEQVLAVNYNAIGSAGLPLIQRGGLMTAASIHYLEPGSISWVERTMEDTNSVIVDPFWVSRQGIASSSRAIVWRCGKGYIKRSTDAGQNWDDVTPVGSFNGVNAADIEFFEVAADAAFLGTFVCGGRYHGGDEWISWLFHTNDDGTNWTYAMTG